MTTALAIHQDDSIDSNPQPSDSITQGELIAVAQSILEPHEFKALLWLCDPRNHSTTLYVGFRAAGYQNDNPDSPLYLRNCQVSREMGKIFGKMEKAGFTRARIVDTMTGLSAERIKARAAELVESDDDKIALKAVDVASKIRGLQGGASSSTVNVQVNLQIKSQVSMILDDCESLPTK